MRMGAELFVPGARPATAPTNRSAAFMTRRFGREATTYLAEPLLAGIHAGDVDRLSLRALFPRFADAEQKHGSLIRAFRRRARRRRLADGAFKSLPGGLSEMVRALVDTLPPDAVQTNADVASIAQPSPERRLSRRTTEGRRDVSTVGRSCCRRRRT